MQTTSKPQPVEAGIDSILHWLALSHHQTEVSTARELNDHLLALRGNALSDAQRLKLLDLIYAHTERIIEAQLPRLQVVALPVSRRTRARVRALHSLLETLAQDFLAAFGQAANGDAGPVPIAALRHALQCLSWHLLIGHLVAATSAPGIWRQIHAVLRKSREAAGAEGDRQDCERIYLATLLIAIAQPASFTAPELAFIAAYADQCAGSVRLSDQAPSGQSGVFWIDPERDSPAHALNRRLPPPETTVLYMACDRAAQEATEHLAALVAGKPAAEAGLPAFADSPGGRGVLRRLAGLWGQPAKRRFQRRHQSYRAELCGGLEALRHRLQGGPEQPTVSEWMITNESPDGFAMMHLSGETDPLRVGDIVAIEPRPGEKEAERSSYICIVRWALSENPEHIEIGLQVLAPRAIPVTVALPGMRSPREHIGGLLLPQVPPLRPLPALVLPAGTVRDPAQKLVVLIERGNLAIHEMRTTQMNEQTSSIEVLTVAPDETP